MSATVYENNYLDYSTTLNVPIHYRQLKIITDEIKSKTVSAIILNECLTENVTHVIKNKLLSMCNNDRNSRQKFTTLLLNRKRGPC